MITKEYHTAKNCVFCVSEYHLEMILLPYIKEKLESSKFIIFTQDDLQDTIDTLLKRINLKYTDKNKIKNINWKKDDKLKYKEFNQSIKTKEKIEIIVYGDQKYIKLVNKNLKKFQNINITDCYKMADPNLNIKEIRKKYNKILNTREI